MTLPLVAQSGTPTPATPSGLTPDQAVTFGATTVGPLEITVLQVLTGPDAESALMAASPFNQPLLETLTPVVVSLRVVNRAPVPVHVGNDDFALTGSTGIVRRYLDSRPPDPVLDITLQPGEGTEGNVVFSSGVDETGRILISDPSGLGGDWAVRFLRLDDSTVVPVAAPQAPNTVGASAAAPAGIGDLVVTTEWALSLLDVITGAAVFDIVDYRTGALGPEDAVGESDGSVWVALRFAITNNAPEPSLTTLPANAFVLTDTEGTPIPDMITITPPRPDASGSYGPGATRDGWVAFDIPGEKMPTLVRFLPFAPFTASTDARFFITGE